MKGIQVVHLDQVEGFQHGKDLYWYRPLLFGKNLFTFVAHVPPGGEMPAHGHADDEGNEMALFMLEGELEITCGREKITVGAEQALLVPLGAAFGVKNNGSVTGSFLLSSYPPPAIESLESLRQRVAARGAKTKSPQEIKIMRQSGSVE